MEPICLMLPSVVSKWPLEGMVKTLPGCRAAMIFLTISKRTDSAALPCWIRKVLGRSSWAAPPLKKPPSYSQR